MPASVALLALSGLLWAGSVAHWIVWGLGLTPTYHHVFHMIASVQAAVTCAAAGLALAGPSQRGAWRWAGVWGLLAVVVEATAAARYAVPNEIMLAVAESAWLVLAGSVTLVRGRGLLAGAPAARRAWLPVALAAGVVGGALVSTYSTVIIVRHVEVGWLVFHGRGLLLQTLPVALVAAGGSALTRFAGASPSPERPVWRHLAWAGLFVLSLPLEYLLSRRLGLGLRAVITAAALVDAGAVPRTIGDTTLARTVTLAVGCLPLGYAVGAVWPAVRSAALHVVFVPGLALLAMVAALVVSGASRGTTPPPWLLRTLVGLTVLSTGLRWPYDLAPETTRGHLVPSAAALIVAALLVTYATVTRRVAR